jgi:hypothetical protein
VVTGGRAVFRLDRLVLETGRQPDGGRSQSPDVIDPVQQPLEVAAVVEGSAGRVEPRHQPVTGQTAPVIAGVAILEAVRHDEIEPLVGDRRAQGMQGAEPPGFALPGSHGGHRGERGKKYGAEDKGEGAAG